MDKAQITEKLTVAITRAPVVWCGHCRAEVGVVRNAALPISLHNLAPMGGAVSPGWLCPSCGRDIRQWLPAGAVIKTDKGKMRCE